MKITCTHCDGAGQWEEGPLRASPGPAVLEPDYDLVICPECEGEGQIERVCDMCDEPKADLRLPYAGEDETICRECFGNPHADTGPDFDDLPLAREARQ